MSIDALDQYEQEKVAQFIPITVRKRKAVLEAIVSEIEKRHFKNLDENSKEDLAKISSIIFEIAPEITERTRREYARVSIRIWKARKSQ